MTAPLAHGGLGGAIVETAILIGIVAVFAAVWLRSRKGDIDDELDPPRVEPSDEPRG